LLFARRPNGAISAAAKHTEDEGMKALLDARGQLVEVGQADQMLNHPREECTK